MPSGKLNEQVASMLDHFRERMASVLTIMAQRLSADPRFPNAYRVPHMTRTEAGVLITPDTAAQISTVWACLRYLSQSVANPPWHVMRAGKGGPEIQQRHPLDSQQAGIVWQQVFLGLEFGAEVFQYRIVGVRGWPCRLEFYGD